MSYDEQIGGCTTPSRLYTPEFDTDQDSPIAFTMSQRAVKLGCEVTWARSPTKRTSTPIPLQQENKLPTPTSSIIRRKSLKMRRKPFFESSPQRKKKGIHEFVEEVKKIRNMTSQMSTSSIPVSNEYTLMDLGSSNNTVSSLNNENKTHIICDNMSVEQVQPSTSSCSNQKINLNTSSNKNYSEINVSELLSKTMQNEFLDDSDFDLELVRSSQEAEEALRRQEEAKTRQREFLLQNITEKQKNARPSTPKAVTSNANSMKACDFLEDDTIDDFMLTLLSSDIDNLIKKSQANKCNTSLGRHNSMPSDRSRPESIRKIIKHQSNAETIPLKPSIFGTNSDDDSGDSLFAE